MRSIRTLAIDIGGTGVKAIVLGPKGDPLTERARVPTPQPATPKAVWKAIALLVEPLGDFQRISVGFPGVVMNGVVHTAPNLHPLWRGHNIEHELEKRLGKPTRAMNDAGVQGYGVIEGRGLEMLLTLGTGMGSALFIDGKYVPNLELAHHPLRHGKTYEQYIGAAALRKIGKKRWNRRLSRVVGQIEPVWNPRQLYLGGGNSRHVIIDLPAHVKLASNIAGLLGGIALWNQPEETSSKTSAGRGAPSSQAR
jgi:polyphosphate glucokinase